MSTSAGQSRTTAGAPQAAPAELLAPAGDERALRAALAAGADAVYFGLEHWSARAFAGNFAGETAVQAVELAHRFGARAHLALNTLLKDDEVGPALAALEAPYLAGLDALIVADLTVAARVRERYPDLELHASTQLNTHSSAQCAALARLGFRRAILARELSLEEIAALNAHGLRLEAFVHGALCYGYSGDCLLSSMVGGRSGNRGRCSQACRMRYRLSREEIPADDDLTRVLSTSDLAAIGVLPQLLAAGVTSFKIEGRMKDAPYVGVTTAVYREALDEALSRPERFAVRPEWMESLEQSFSRSFTVAHLEGRHWEVRSGGRGGHRGVLVGRVERVDDWCGEVVVRLQRPVAAGDVVYLYTSSGQTEPQRVERAAQDRLVLKVRERVSPKDRLFRLDGRGRRAARQRPDGGARPAAPDRSRHAHRRCGGRAGRPAGVACRRPRRECHRVVPGAARRRSHGRPGRDPLAAGLRGARQHAVRAEGARERPARRPLPAGGGAEGAAAAGRRGARRAPGRGPPPHARSVATGVCRDTQTTTIAVPALAPRHRGRSADVVLRFRPHEEPLAAPGAALCLELTTTDPLPEISAACCVARDASCGAALPAA